MRDKDDETRIKAYMEAKMKHIKMYNECMNLADGLDVEKFAELVRADERGKVAQWMVQRGYATGHGDTIEDLLQELEWQVAERERQACLDLCDKIEAEAYQVYGKNLNSYEDGVSAGARACMEEIGRRK
jgi:hypothetical protein